VTTEEQVLERIARARGRKARLKDERVTLAHGAGGRATANLVEALFLDAFRNPALEALGDGALLDLGSQRLAVTTDSFVVSPLFFPGGSIGDLAVNGTVNDLAACGSRPLALTAGFVLEEGLPIADLERIVRDMAAAAERAGVPVVTGDTKVVERGKGDGCFVNTTGIGLVRPGVSLSIAGARPGDQVLVSGPIGDHGTTVMVARGELDLAADVRSDTAALGSMVEGLLDATAAVRALRDPTRGGLATVLNEIAVASSVSVLLDERTIPVRPGVAGCCELLGIDPLYVACEGRMVVVVGPEGCEAALGALRAHPLGREAAVVGEISPDPPGLVLLKTAFGGSRIVDMMVGDPLPRIC